MGWLHSALVIEMMSARNSRSVEMKDRNDGGQGMSYTADADAMICRCVDITRATVSVATLL